jgi:hypothetical protein
VSVLLSRVCESIEHLCISVFGVQVPSQGERVGREPSEVVRAEGDSITAVGPLPGSARTYRSNHAQEGTAENSQMVRPWTIGLISIMPIKTVCVLID